jgi:hypothetical protein
MSVTTLPSTGCRPAAEVQKWPAERREPFEVALAYGAFELGHDKISERARDALIKLFF